jgi:hypothetical protein
MYRDDLQALQARVETLRGELEAVRTQRRGAETRRRRAEERLGLGRGRFSLWPGLRIAAAVVALLALCAFGGWRVLGHDHRAALHPGATAAPCAPSALLVHVHPPGASLLVDGALLTDDAPAEGMLVPVAPRSTAEVVAIKDGFLPKRLLVETGDCGPRHVFIAARRRPGKARR